MPVALHSLAVATPGFFRLGRLQLPVFGVIATAGLLAGLALSRRTARLAGLDADRLWDAGVLAVVSAFAASRLLLAAVNLRLFLAHPLLVLAQPSLTAGGLALTALILWLWLHRHRLPILRVLDAWAAPAALLAAVLQLGHFVEGTDAGMPTTLPWGVHTPGDLTFARVHPVQLYAVAGSFALCAWLLRLLAERVWSGHGFSRAVIRSTISPASAAEGSPSGPKPSRREGYIAAVGLLAGGVLSLCLSFFRQPYDPLSDAWLDPGQYAALAAMLAGIVLFATITPKKINATPAQLPAEEPS